MTLALLTTLLVGMIAVDVITSRDEVPQQTSVDVPFVAGTPAASNQLGDLGSVATTADTDASITGGATPVAPETVRQRGPDWLRFAEIALALIIGWVLVTAYGWRGMGGRA